MKCTVDRCTSSTYWAYVLLQAKEFGRKAVVASENNPDDNFSRNIVEFMKVCERVK